MTSNESISRLDRLAFAYPNRRVVLGTQTKDKNKVDATSTAYDRMWVDWELIDDLRLGRDQMILKERRWLPQETGEDFKNYVRRLYRSFLFGGFVDTIESLACKPFAKEVMVQNEERLPENVSAMFDNIDLAGNDITSFSKKLFSDALMYGHSIVLVDMPSASPEQVRTLAEEREMGIRPYWVHISPPNLIGWRSTTDVTGKEILTQIRYREYTVEPDGQFGDREVEVIKVWNAPMDGQVGTVETWKRAKEGEDFEVSNVVNHTYPGIPLVWLPLKPTGQGILMSTPPFKSLAELNLEHWQLSSDHNNILRFVSIAMVLITGMSTGGSDDEETGGSDQVIWGVNSFIEGPPEADAKYVEHSGKGIEALSKALREIEGKMEQMGVEPLMSRQSDVTATAQNKDDKKRTTLLQSWVRRLETTLLWALNTTYTWLEEDNTPLLPTEGDDQVMFDVFSEFGTKVFGTNDAADILRARVDGEISRETFLTEWQKRGYIGEEVDIQAEAQKLEQEALANAEAFGFNPDEPEDQAEPDQDGFPDDQ